MKTLLAIALLVSSIYATPVSRKSARAYRRGEPLNIGMVGNR